MAAQLGIKIISGASDGAAAELAAQNMMDNLPSEKEQIVYENMEHGYRIKVAVHETGPFFANQDPEHRRKTGRNQPQHGTKTASLGEGFIVNRSLVDLCKSPDSGMYHADVINVDKQDDGAARRFYHCKALCACTETIEGVSRVKDGFLGIYVYLFVLGRQIFFDLMIEIQLTCY